MSNSGANGLSGQTKIGSNGYIQSYPNDPTGSIVQVGQTLYAGKGLGVGGAPLDRIPIGLNAVIDGSTLSAGTVAADKVGAQLNITFKGGFSGEAGMGAVDPGFIWGSDDFITTGKNAGDLAGITDFWGKEIEVHLLTPSASLNNYKAVHVETRIGANNVTVANVYGIHIARQTVDGTPTPTGVAVTNWYGLRVDSPVGATNNYGIYVQNSNTQSVFEGPLNIGAAIGGGTHQKVMTWGPNTATGQELIIADPTANKGLRGQASFFPANAGQVGITITAFNAQSADLMTFEGSATQSNAAILAGGTYLSDNAGHGIILKDTNGHYWRTTVSTAGVITTADLGTSRPTA